MLDVDVETGLNFFGKIVFFSDEHPQTLALQRSGSIRTAAEAVENLRQKVSNGTLKTIQKASRAMMLEQK